MDREPFPKNWGETDLEDATTAHELAKLNLPFQNLSVLELLAIDEAAGAVLDNGFGTLELKFEFTALKWITKHIPVKMQPLKAA